MADFLVAQHFNNKFISGPYIISQFDRTGAVNVILR
jgi:hypothetical protein